MLLTTLGSCHKLNIGRVGPLGHSAGGQLPRGCHSTGHGLQQVVKVEEHWGHLLKRRQDSLETRLLSPDSKSLYAVVAGAPSVGGWQLDPPPITPVHTTTMYPSQAPVYFPCSHRLTNCDFPVMSASSISPPGGRLLHPPCQ